MIPLTISAENSYNYDHLKKDLILNVTISLLTTSPKLNEARDFSKNFGVLP